MHLTFRSTGLNAAFRLLVAMLLCALPIPAQAATAPADVDLQPVVLHYAALAEVRYDDALMGAIALRDAVDALLGAPSAAKLYSARAAWRAARVPYMQTEVFRFANPLVDAWEPRVNAWPLDEGLIDYVDTKHYGDSSDTNRFDTANIIANPLIVIGSERIDASIIDASLLQRLREADGTEANVTTGFHAIEFLLWGQDLGGTDGGAANRPWTDYAMDACSNRHCDRRRAYLAAVTASLVEDLREMALAWRADGAARSALLALSSHVAIGSVLRGIGSLSSGELAGERMRLGLLLNDPEEEHDCFSDNTHNAHYYDLVGIRDLYFGRYTRLDGQRIEGASLAALVATRDAQANQAMAGALDASLAALQKIKAHGDSGHMHYDQMLAEDNVEGRALIQSAIDALAVQTQALETIVERLGLGRLTFEVPGGA